MAEKTFQDLVPVASTLVVALSGAGLAILLGLPAAPLFGSTIAVLAFSLAGREAKLPNSIRDVGIAIIGLTLGASVTPHFLSDLARFPVTILGVTITMAVVMIITSAMTRKLTDTDGPTSVLATSPGA